MSGSLWEAVARLILERTGRPAVIAKAHGAGGGSISHAEILELEDGRRFFLKSNPAPLPWFFECELAGLEALSRSETLRVPAALGIGGAPGAEVVPFIVLEAITVGSEGASFFEDFGRQLATLHRETRAPRPAYGFDADNYLGATAQPNPWTEDWCDFWRWHRLGFQLRLARRKGLADATLSSLGDRLLARLDKFLAQPEEPPCLLHGDLWGGNYLVGEDGQPVLIDPAVYYGRREADLAMTRLFGGFSRRFYDAYEEAWPLAEGWRERLEIYKLYHLLNHLNLFGSSYRSQCLSILKRFV